VSETSQHEWRLVSPRYLIEAYLSTIVFFIAPIAVATVPLWIEDDRVSQASWYPLAALGIVAVLALFLVPRRVKALGYQLRADDLVFRRGILYRRQVAVPYGRLQLVDISRGPVSRMLGLSELRLMTAAASTGVTIPGLIESDAEELRNHLMSVAETRRAGL
jgi:hypothetical protein